MIATKTNHGNLLSPQVHVLTPKKALNPVLKLKPPIALVGGRVWGRSETRKSANDYSLGQRNVNDLLKLVFWPAKVAGRTGSYLRVRSS